MPSVEVAPCDHRQAHDSHDWEWHGEWVWCPGRDHDLAPVKHNRAYHLAAWFVAAVIVVVWMALTAAAVWIAVH